MRLPDNATRESNLRSLDHKSSALNTTPPSSPGGGAWMCWLPRDLNRLCLYHGYTAYSPWTAKMRLVTSCSKVLVLAQKWLSRIVCAKVDMNAKIQCRISKMSSALGGFDPDSLLGGSAPGSPTLWPTTLSGPTQCWGVSKIQVSWYVS